MSADDHRLCTTPSTNISRPRDGLCVACKHHGSRQRSCTSGFQNITAAYLTCKVREFRSVINGETSDWCHDIRADNQPCGLWENDRSCRRCKHAVYNYMSAECRHPSFEKKFKDGEFKGQSYWPDQHGHTYKKNGAGMFGLERVHDESPHCGEGAPLWEDGPDRVRT